ncbi:DsrE family protein [Leeuwenhoekiella sp. MAR_2009_132]|uniref:DsrE family protein n=1 Tax=Leeuwenhoekiella sp. MAR_2009_132 TaxID=1392489 RepID=UPI000561D25D|nr:DsrE family protein [Leeuwenhoekiella sp. MAR_2009_132]
MHFKFAFALFIFISAFSQNLRAQEKITGPLINDFGATYTVSKLDIPIDVSQTYKVVFDISKSPENPSELNPYFNTVARFLNMNHAAGVPQNQLKPVLVIHGSAAFSLLNNEFHKEKYGVDNPNIELLEQLYKLNIPVVLCGQTAGARDITSEKRWQHTQLALSAMNALIYYQNLDYALISF